MNEKKIHKKHNESYQISSIEFGMMSAAEIEAMSNLQVSNLELYVLPERTPAPYGFRLVVKSIRVLIFDITFRCLDPRLGVFQKIDKCKTCNLSLGDCPGQFLIKLY